MKELSIEEKAKRYDEAIKRAKEYDFSLTGVCVGDIIEDVFPELKESENERIRKVLKEYFINSFQINGVAAICGVHIKDILAWLEKQGEKDKFIKKEIGYIKGYRENAIKRLEELENQCEQILANSAKTCKDAWSEEDDYNLQCCIAKIQYDIDNGRIGRNMELLTWLKSLKDRVQQQEQMWSIEDEYNQAFIIEMLYGLEDKDKEYEKKCRKMAEWLKSLRPQKRWKPSEEMLEALYRAIPENVMEISEDEMLLDKLYQGLKYGRVLSNK